MSGSGAGSRSPSFQEPNCVRHPHHNLLQELLYCFQGVDGNIVKFDKSSGFTIRNDVSFEQSHMVYQFLELGFLFHSVKGLLERQRECMVTKGLREAVQEKLTGYSMYIAQLQSEHQERQVGFHHLSEGRVDLVLLTRVLPWAREKMLALQFMITILNETKGLLGGAILNPILKHLPHGNPLLRETFEDLFQKASAPIYHMVWHWIVMGSLKNHFHEFFVQENIEYSRTKAWQCQFTLRNEYIPQSLDGTCAKIVLDIGKSVHFISKFHPEKALEFSAAKRGVFDYETGDLNSFVTDGKPALELRRMHVESSKLVLDIMKTKYKLREFFTQLHDYIFLMQGQFASYFMELLDPYLHKTVADVSPSHLKKLLHEAMRNCSTLATSVYDNIDVHFNEFTEDDVIGDVFSLRYKMNGPIKIMFQIFDLSYRKLFMFLWKKNHVLHRMSKTWKLMRTLFKMTLPSGVQRGLRHLFTLNFQLMRFLNQLDFYIVYEVIGSRAKEFLEEFELITAIDDVVDAHAKMLRFILLGTLLEDHADIGVQLTNIFSLVPDIENLTMSVFIYVENVGGAVVTDAEHQLNAKVGILLKNNEIAIKNFIAFLKSCKHADGLNAVCDRLNYNEFYLPDCAST